MKRTLQIYISDVYISKSYVAYFKSKSFPPFPLLKISYHSSGKKNWHSVWNWLKMSHLNDHFQTYSYVYFWCKKYA